MRALKILVVVMGVLLVAGFAALVAVIVGRLAPRPSGAAPQAYVTAPLELPAGARIEHIGIGGDRLAVDMVLGDGSREIVVIDFVTGRRLATIPLRQPR